MVELKGEVHYPGEYLIRPDETLFSVIERAGGFTDEGFINAALFTRESVKIKEREQLLILGDSIRRNQASRSMTMEAEDFPVSSEEIETGIAALLETEVIGRLIIELPRLLSGDVTADIVLQDGDVLDVPKFTNAVTVVGQVRRSGSFVRQESYTLDDYIELAAGITARGNKKEIYVIRADGSVDRVGNTSSRLLQFSDANDNILAGDTIVVPIKSSYQTPLNLYRTISTVVFQSIASLGCIWYDNKLILNYYFLKQKRINSYHFVDISGLCNRYCWVNFFGNNIYPFTVKIWKRSSGQASFHLF